ncbi:FG-GAP-like repeat-containing protein [Pelagicoccus sp. SDUM812003]|uniref:FG-GAP-like repeat-containing protein n=1 Tax=Pelagicoccus sp. SDUM812003 TaxID=3041267 RepID=UPI00280C4E01|nr:FG-GAP-like repeat-containing protein [Pelagicoccus sp. SDUM812003]MDQ8202467.1 FG-GAP-like repeat-containing protein [Pelagicoccus sp. SDUM812003]
MLLSTPFRLLPFGLTALALTGSAAAQQTESQPLNPPKVRNDAAATLFTDIPPASIGIEFHNTYDDPQMWGRLYREFTLGAVGAGVATGDFDMDGLPDIYAVSKTGPNKLFRQTAPFQFEDVTESAGVAGSESWCTGSTFVDINDDGWLDLYICNFAAPNQLFVNQKDGTFTEQAAAYGLDISDASVMAAFADYDRDGDLDLYLQTNILDYNQSFKGRPDYFLRNDGEAGFTDITAEAGIWGISQGHSATWWDYNHDGWPDIYVANDFENSDRLYRNNGDGSFTDVLSETIPHTSYFSMGSDLGDVTNNGLTDFFVGDMAATTHEKDKTGMAEMGRGIWENERVDTLFPMYMRNAFYLNNGTERFNEIAYMNRLDASDWTWSVKFSDLDNDGWNDLFITNGNIRNFMEADLLDKQNVAFNLAARIRVYKNAPPLEERNLAFRNNGDLNFENVSKQWGLDHLGISFGASYSDLDRDGDLDLVVNNYDDNLKIYRNNSSSNGLLLRLKGVSSNEYGIGSILYLESSAGTQTRQLTLARGVLSSDEPLVHFGLGDDASARSLAVHWPSGHSQRFENLSAGQLYTITEPSGDAELTPVKDAATHYQETAQFIEASRAIGLKHTHQEAYYNELTTQLLLPRRLAKQGPALGWGDIDRDGKQELIIGGATDFPTQAFRLQNGAFTAVDLPEPLLQREGETLGIAVLDDFTYLANGGVEAGFEDLALGASGKPLSATLPHSSTSVLAAADIDGDGDLDLFVGGRSVPGSYPDLPRSYLFENRDGSLVDVTEKWNPKLAEIGMVSSALWSDANDDGRPDLLLALEWDHPTLLLNTGSQLEDASESAGWSERFGWWNSVAAGDFNEDGRMDYVFGNVGLNTKYLASPERPTLLFDGVFEEGGESHLIEAQYEDGDENLYPIRPYSKLRYAFPSLGNKFPSFQSFADATLEEIFDPALLEQAQRYQATHLASALFLSQEDGSYAGRELPRLAQIAPIYGMAIQDFNGDGHIDLMVAQNSFSPEPTTGRFNGGLSLLLTGDGTGNLSAVTTSESGIMVRGDAKALITADLDQNGWADLIVSQNSDKTLVFKNRGISGRNSFSVSLVGQPGNRHAYGARITTIYADGSQATSEIASHVGYLSQPQATSFFGYASENPPKAIKVRWPDGEVTEQPFDPKKATYQLSR